MIEIEQVEKGSAAELAGVRAGDSLLAVNGRPIEDIVDYFLAIDNRTDLELLLQCGDAAPDTLSLELEEGESPGLLPQHPEPTSCGNNCIFCFVHQLPKDLRRTLYVKDEDYRFSWLYGSYITLGNSDEAQLDRIVRDRLSPLYISVHATDEAVRCRLLGKQVAPILPLLQRLAAAGIELHTQVVLCPGHNDGAVLEHTISDLAKLWPQVRSLAIVPVGLTEHRAHLPHIEPVSPRLAAATLDLIEHQQQALLRKNGSRFVFAADEFYLRALREFPSLQDYEEMWQLENGVGMVALFRSEAEEVLLESLPLDLGKVSLITGMSFAGELAAFAGRLQTRVGTRLQVVAVENRFFGSSVTVTGLLTGADILAACEDIDPGEALLLPEVLFNAEAGLLLDDMRLEELEHRLGIPVLCISSDPWGILDGLERLDCRDIEIFSG